MTHTKAAVALLVFSCLLFVGVRPLFRHQVWAADGEKEASRGSGSTKPEPVDEVGQRYMHGGGTVSDSSWHYAGDEESGKTKKTNIEIDGKKATHYESWWQNGKLCQEFTTLQDGKLHGKFVNGYDNGQKADELDYDDGEISGRHRSWYRTGKEKSRTEYKSGLREGSFLYWHPNGTKACEAAFAKDRLDGRWQQWDADGKLIKTIEYREGKLVSEEPARNTKLIDYPGPLGTRDFAFILAEGGYFKTGFATLRVSACGHCDYVYHFFPYGYEARTSWRKAEFDLTEKEQRALRDWLKEADLVNLKDKYKEPNLADGSQSIIALRTKETTKRILCDNKFPKAVVTLSDSVGRQILLAHRLEIRAASAVEPLEREDPRETPFLEAPGK